MYKEKKAHLLSHHFAHSETVTNEVMSCLFKLKKGSKFILITFQVMLLLLIFTVNGCSDKDKEGLKKESSAILANLKDYYDLAKSTSEKAPSGAVLRFCVMSLEELISKYEWAKKDTLASACELYELLAKWDGYISETLGYDLDKLVRGESGASKYDSISDLNARMNAMSKDSKAIIKEWNLSYRSRFISLYDSFKSRIDTM